MTSRPDTTALGVGWAGCQVVIEVAAMEARPAVTGTFAALLEPPRPDALACVTLRRESNGYVVMGGLKPNAVDGSVAGAVRDLRYQVTLHFMAARPDLLWLHAAGASRAGRAVLICGRGGSGKSTLVTRLVTQGFSYLSDDVIPLDLATGAVLPFPITPTIRTDPGGPLSPEAVRALPRAEVLLDPARIARAPVPVGLVVFPSYEAGAGTAEPCPPARAALRMLSRCFDFARHRERAVQTVCDLVSGWPAVGLRYGDADWAASEVARAHLDATAGHAMAG